MPEDFQTHYEKVSEVAKATNMKIRFDDHVGENDAAILLGYASGDTLRKQGAGRILPYITRGNRRFYSLAEIARVWAGK